MIRLSEPRPVADLYHQAGQAASEVGVDPLDSLQRRQLLDQAGPHLPDLDLDTTLLPLNPPLDLGGRALGHEPPMVDHRNGLAQLVGLEHVVRRQQDGASVLHEPGDELPQLLGTHRVQAHRRLVHEQHGRVGEQPAGDVEPLLHAPRVLLHLPVGVLRQPHLLQVKVGAPPRLPRAHVVERREVAEVLPAGQAAVQTAVPAEDEPDPPPDLPSLPDHIVPQDPGSPRGRSQQRRQDADRGGLSRPVGAQQTEDDPPGHPERQVSQGHGLPSPSQQAAG